jgi:hypothetical protein
MIHLLQTPRWNIRKPLQPVPRWKGGGGEYLIGDRIGPSSAWTWWSGPSNDSDLLEHLTMFQSSSSNPSGWHPRCLQCLDASAHASAHASVHGLGRAYIVPYDGTMISCLRGQSLVSWQMTVGGQPQSQGAPSPRFGACTFNLPFEGNEQDGTRAFPSIVVPSAGSTLLQRVVLPGLAGGAAKGAIWKFKSVVVDVEPNSCQICRSCADAV